MAKDSLSSKEIEDIDKSVIEENKINNELASSNFVNTFYSESEKFKLGIKEVDDFLNNGLEKGVINLIYGSAGVGKTTIALLSSFYEIEKGKKVLYIDSDNSVSSERFFQILANSDFSKSVPDYLNNIIFLKPRNVYEFEQIIKDLDVLLDDVDLVVFDTISSLFRLEFFDKGLFELNKKIVNALKKIDYYVSKKSIGCLLLNQVFSFFSKDNSLELTKKDELVGGEILTYHAKSIIKLNEKLQKENNKNSHDFDENNDYNSLVLEKHRFRPRKTFYYEITNTGISVVDFNFDK
jgi:DNA repair protein RadB